MKKLFVVALALLMSASFAYAKDVKIAVLTDESGPTADVGKPYAQGIRDCVRYFNENGGLNGDKIKPIMIDYGYKIPQAISAYKKFKRAKVVAIHGWGTGDTENLLKFIKKDKIPYFSASYSAHLADAKHAPYNFMVGATYSDQTKIAIKYIKESGDNKSVAFVYNDTGFGRSPFFPDGENYAKEIGVPLVDTQVVGLKALDATSQLLNMKKKNPGYAIVQETYMATSTLLKDSKKLDVPTKFIGLNWTFGKKLVELVGDKANGFLATNAFALWNETDNKGIKFLHDLNKKYHPEVTYRKVNYIQGFTSMYVLLSALKEAKGNYKGANIKKILESGKAFDTMGITAPVTFSDKVHSGVKALRMYKIEDQKLMPFTDYISAN
jgi:branched-chain amino acid transport system substrate-binding protein